jgi:rSAM/selenodomain-associated transferase 1
VRTQIVVVAKAPVAGRVKTRLCPPCTPAQAARIARAALSDTVDAVNAAPAARRVLLLDGDYPAPRGWAVVAQRGEGLGRRLANGMADSARAATATVLLGMDTPQVTPALLATVTDHLSNSDGVLGMAADGGWWVLALREPALANVLSDIPMSRADTGELTRQAFAARGLSIAQAPMLRDVDTFSDLREVAALCPDGHFAAAARELI